MYLVLIAWLYVTVLMAVAEVEFDGKAVAAAMPAAPGVYRMINADGGVLYVGKARALRNRVGSYFNGSPKTRRIMMMLAQVVRAQEVRKA